MSSSPSESPTSTSDGTSGLSTSDIVGIAVGIPSGLLALVGVVISFCAWKYPKTPVGQLGSAIRRQLLVRGGDARGGDAQGPRARGGNARGGDANVDANRNADTSIIRDIEKQEREGGVRGGNAQGGNARGQNVRGGDAHGGDAFVI